MESLPDESAPVIRRWETFRSVFAEGAFLTTVKDGGKWKGAATAGSRKKKMLKQDVIDLFDKLQAGGAFGKYVDGITADQKRDIQGTSRKTGKSSNIEAWSQRLQALQERYNADYPETQINPTTSSALKDHNLQSLCTTDVKRLEPYWRWFWRNASHNTYDKSKFCTLIDRADLILEVGYFCADSGLFKKRVVVCEVDGDQAQ